MTMPPTSLRVENCPTLELNLQEPLPWPLSSLLLANISSLFITLSSNSMQNTRELIILDSTIVSDFRFTNKKGSSKLVVDGCTFEKHFAIYSHLGAARDIPDLVSIVGSEFREKVEIVTNGEGGDAKDTFLLLQNNWWGKHFWNSLKQLTSLILKASTFLLLETCKLKYVGS